MWRDPLDIVWRSADNPNPVFAAEDLDGMPSEIMARLAEMNILRPSATASHGAVSNRPSPLSRPCTRRLRSERISGWLSSR